jgi:hypothetical protein
MIRNKNARRRIRENRKEISAWNGPVKIDTHVMIARAGNDSLPLRRGWKAMQEQNRRRNG